MDERNAQYARLAHWLDIDMVYEGGINNNQTGKARRLYTMKTAGRFGMVAPVLIKNIYGISQRMALVHLNKLVDEGYLALVATHRVPDGRVYVLTNAGAAFAGEVMQIALPFRSQSEPSRQLNHNTLSHDLMNAYILLRGVNNKNKQGEYLPLWTGFISEREFARIYSESDIRNVDGIVREPNADETLCAIEIENSFKTKAMRQTILAKLAHSLDNGLYEKVFFFSQRQSIFDDAKRFHQQIFDDARTTPHRKKKNTNLTLEQINTLDKALIYRTKFCDELQRVFYP